MPFFMKTIEYIKKQISTKVAKENGYTDNVISNKEFLNEIIISKERDVLTNRALEIIQKMVSHTLTYLLINIPANDKKLLEDIVIMDCLEKWRKFDDTKLDVYSYFRALIGTKLSYHIDSLNDKRVVRYNDILLQDDK